MEEIKFKIKSVNILITDSTDQIYIYPDLPSSFPEMQYDPVIKMECRKGYAEEYCKDVLKIKEFKIINVNI